VEIEEVSTRLFDNDTEAAGKRTTPDLNLGVIESEIIMEAIKAIPVSKIRIHFLSHANRTRSKALFTKTLFSGFFSIMDIICRLSDNSFSFLSGSADTCCLTDRLL
jgi:hypothetical protein